MSKGIHEHIDTHKMLPWLPSGLGGAGIIDVSKASVYRIIAVHQGTDIPIPLKIGTNPIDEQLIVIFCPIEKETDAMNMRHKAIAR